MGGVFLLLSKISFYGTALILVILILVLSFKFNKKMENKEDNEVSNEYIASYFDGEYQTEIPGKDDGYVVDKIVCDNGATATWDNEEWGINIRNATEKIKCSIYFKFKTEYDFDYTGAEQEFVIHKTGMYKIELWGAQGGNTILEDENYSGGLGGYTSGNINLSAGTSLFVYVGEHSTTINGGYNGGANGGISTDGAASYTGGGGSTDIRIMNGYWKDFSSLKSRIMVAAGGGGTGTYCKKIINGGSSGGLTGEIGTFANCGSTTQISMPTGGSQVTGGTIGIGYFGYSSRIGTNNYGTGGGGGYYGGGSGGSGYAVVSAGAGGSSFISGHEGCDAIKEESTEDNIIHTGQSIYYSGMYFTDTVIIDGEGYKWTTEKGEYTGMPSHDGTGTIQGNTGNGYARITYIGNDK